MKPGAQEEIDSSEGVRITLHYLGGPSESTNTPVLLFSHATGFHGRVWEPMAYCLSDEFHCVSLDLRGHGTSEVPPGVGVAWSGMADDIVAALRSDHFPPGPVHGIGHSMGGAALVMAAAQRSDAFRSLWLYEPVIFPTGAGPPSDGDNAMSEVAARRRAKFDSLEQAYENYRSKPPLNQLHPDALRAYVEGGFDAEPDGSVTLRCRPSTEADVFRQAAPSGAWSTIPSIEVPVAVVSGRPDHDGPEAFAPIVAEAFPDGILFVRSDLGHFGPLEDPEAMAAAVADWVRAHD